MITVMNAYASPEDTAVGKWITYQSGTRLQIPMVNDVNRL